MKRFPLFAATLFVSLAASGAAPAYQRAGELEWVCGGVGAEERRALATLAPGASLEIVMVTAKRGGYVSGAELSLHGSASAPPLLRQVALGPICYFRLPPGAYRIEATLDGVRREARAAVKAGGTKPARVVIPFPDEPWDGIRSSEEERRQAREP